jgi:hypothetical protein
MTLAFNFHPEAQAEFAADVGWFDARKVGAGACEPAYPEAW